MCFCRVFLVGGKDERVAEPIAGGGFSAGLEFPWLIESQVEFQFKINLLRERGLRLI